MQKHKPTPARRLMAGTALAGLTLNALVSSSQTAVAADTAQATTPPAMPAPELQKPAWLTEVSVTAKETYDDNILMVSGNGPTKVQSSFVTSATGKFSFNFAPLLGEQSIFQTLGFGYSPEVSFYHNAQDESYNSHRFTQLVKGKADDFSFNLDNNLYYVDGSDTTPIYEGEDKYRNAFASVGPRDRREQLQDRAKAVLQYDIDSFFIRPTASLLYYNMMTDLKSTAGYQNYPSRSDVNGGLDFGYRVTDATALTLGYRYGRQYQQQMSAALDSTMMESGSDYQRVLMGFEGKPWSWLTLAAQAGPDFRSYDDAAGIADKNDVTYYAEASATAELTDNDSLSFKYKQWRFVAYGGRLPYFDSNYELTYHRKLLEQLSFDLTGRIASYDFTCGSDPKEGNLRDDYLFSIQPSVTYAFTRHFSVTASGSIDFGRSLQDDAPGGNQYREFDHNLAMLAATYKF